MAFMIHPLHGATNTNDIDGHEKNGWSVSSPEQWIAQKDDKINVIEEPLADPHIPARRGRKPKQV